MPKNKTRRGTEDLKDNAGPSKRSRLSSDPKKDKEISSAKVINYNHLKVVVCKTLVKQIESFKTQKY